MSFHGPQQCLLANVARSYMLVLELLTVYCFQTNHFHFHALNYTYLKWEKCYQLCIDDILAYLETTVETTVCMI